MIEIPFWWNQKIESLVGTIRLHRPDLLISPKLSSSGHSLDPIPSLNLTPFSIVGEGGKAFVTKPCIEFPSRWRSIFMSDEFS